MNSVINTFRVADKSFDIHLPLLRITHDRVVFFLPSMVYDLTQQLFFRVNYAICGLCYLQPHASKWNEPNYQSQDLSGSGKPLEIIQREILNPIDMAHNEHDLVRLYDSLPSVSADDLIGHSWRGKILRTNHSVLDLAEWAIIRPLSKLGFGWGKRYRSADKGDPLLLNWKSRIFAPVPIWGNVDMTDIRWRGVPTATMNYDHQPWKDYFRLLSNDQGKMVLLGVWTHKQLAGGWFTLTLDAETPTEPS